ncbi:leucine-rich repeat-containing G-protein coupled receptor 5-like isoform X1 [Saccostrea cucullata]|uniref:leucine-rich repeat-containing G-protein coupled receptor 5-like isoform X1 n=1 Tax=Saccostrea cuccullata TaxID=36930 RepID=UPI002ED1ABA6
MHLCILEVLILLTLLLMYGGISQSVCPPPCFCSYPEIVECSGKNLTIIPNTMAADIKKLDLSMNNLTLLPDHAFSRYKHLKALRLAGNGISAISETAFFFLHNLESLFLMGNNLTSLHGSIFQHLYRLTELFLDANKIASISSSAFDGLFGLLFLRLDANNLTEIPQEALARLERLQALDLSVNKIQQIKDFAFSNNTNLGSLALHDNRISVIRYHAFEGLNVLTSLELQRNRLTHVPAGIMTLPDLMDLNLENNRIQFIPSHVFQLNKNLRDIKLRGNPISSFGLNTFQGLHYLRELTISEARDLEHFPNVTGCKSLQLLRLDRASISEVPADLCRTLPDLFTLDLHSNKLSRIPDLEHCYNLKQLNLGSNKIASLEGSPFMNATRLQDLTLSHNFIPYIGNGAFKGLRKLEYLDLQSNQITGIEPLAFKPLESLIDLNLAENTFSRLPTEGLSRLKFLKTFHNTNLQERIDPENLPNIQNLVLSYAYHCCSFINARKADFDFKGGSKVAVDEEVIWLHTPNKTDHSLWDHQTFFSLENHTLDFPNYFEDYDIQFPTFDGDSKIPSLEAIPTDSMARVHPPIKCTPVPGPFLPCDDLFGWWSLRCGVWIVFLLAVVGNGIVLFVSITARSKMSMDVPRFLICNLACADFMMGAYLGILAILDASTLDEFQFYAIKWQRCGGCLTAGFLGIVSSMLSVFTLTVITVERFYAISNAMQINKRIRLKQAGIIMTVGWIFSISNATLPFFGISDYRKFAICLPFETSDNASLAYVCFLMFFNAVSFIIIVICYIKMYCSIMGSNAWNSKDFRIAKRMAILVFTDFLCWAPIIFFSITAAFGKNLIGLNEAKVLTIFVLPLNSCANPFLYAIFTKQFKRDCVKLCRRIEESSLTRSFSNLNSRRVSFGSSWRQSQFQSPFQTEKRSSITNSVSAGSVGVGTNQQQETNSGLFENNEKCKVGEMMYSIAENNHQKETRLPELVNQNVKTSTGGGTGPDRAIVIHLNDQKDKILQVHTKKSEKCQEGSSRKSHPKRLHTRATPVRNANDEDVSSEEDNDEALLRQVTDMPKRSFMDHFKKRKVKNDCLGLTSLLIKQHGRSAPNVQMPENKGTLLLPTTNSTDKTSHINEWRKSSHLNYIMSNSQDMEQKFPSYKSNSLVDLNFARKGFEGSPCKRRSLSSHHEGYLMLKNSNRDSAYEDEEEMLEYNNCKTFKMSHSKPVTPQHMSELPYSDELHNCEKRQTMADICQSTASERSQLLSVSNTCSPRREVCDKESGFSSEA